MFMEKNLAVVYTEYQLLQVEAIITYYRLKNVVLVLHNTNNRISNWLIDDTLFEKIVQMPLSDKPKKYRLTKAYLQEYSLVALKILQDMRINIMIGAQDENTIFAIFKKQAKPRYYWNIEDGNANYLRENFKYRLKLFVKKQFFAAYGYKALDIRYGHGLGPSDKAFRLYPKLSVGRRDCIPIHDILSNYLKAKVAQIRPRVNWITKYKHFSTLVVSDVSLMPRILATFNGAELYKFHPENKPDNTASVPYIREHIPIEFLPWLLPHLQTIRYQIYSSSLLNMLVLHPNLNIKVDYKPPNKAYTYYTNNIITEFEKRIEVIQC